MKGLSVQITGVKKTWFYQLHYFQQVGSFTKSIA